MIDFIFQILLEADLVALWLYSCDGKYDFHFYGKYDFHLSEKYLAPQEVVIGGPVDVSGQAGGTTGQIERVELILKSFKI